MERFHRQLKVCLLARLAGTDWYAHLPLVLLGLRSVPKEDSSVSASEALFGAPLVLPGEFLDSPELPSEEYLQLFSRFSRTILFLHLIISLLLLFQVQQFHLLSSAAYIFFQEDSSMPPLYPLYRGPYRVLSRTLKYFVV